MGWIADVLIAVLAACAVGLMLYQKVRRARGQGGCGCSGCVDGGCTACSERTMERERKGQQSPDRCDFYP